MLTVVSAGCASKGSKNNNAAAGAAMMCPKCETVWVREASVWGPHHVTTWTSKANMTCPECDAMAKSQLMGDGKVMLHECPTCKVTPIRVDPAKATHPKGTHP